MPDYFKKIVTFCFSFILFSTTAHANQQLLTEPDSGRAPITKAIAEAKSSITLVMYGFTDKQLINALIRAKESGINVRVLLQHYPYKNDDENTNAIERLQAAHINLRWPSEKYQLTHEKMLLIDNRYALVMTFNFTRSTFDNQRNFALLIDDPKQLKEIQQVFNADWQDKSSSVEQANLMWSPDNSRGKLLTLLRNAQSRIDIYADNISDYATVGLLAKAARAGVAIRILASPHFRVDSKPYQYLKKAGVLIRTVKRYYIHAKIIMIDNKLVVVGSMNLTKPSINRNRELSVITHDAVVIDGLQKVFEKDWSSV